MDIALTISNRQISPGVVNLFQFENNTTTLKFTLDSYMHGEVDLRNYKAYAVTSINGNIDMTELVATYDASKDKLTLAWDVKEYTLMEAGAVLYQIVFKEATASGIPDEGENTGVFYSYKAVIINREVIDGDNEISAKYPTILKQWLDRMNSMADLYDAGVIYMDYGQSIPPADRLSGRLYFQYTDTLNTRGQFEDDNGNILSETNIVHDIGDETIAGLKTFTTSPKVPTPASDSNDTTVANTAFVQSVARAGLRNTATGENAIAVDGATAAGNWATAMGSGASAKGSSAVAVGSSAKAPANAATAVGPNTTASGAASVALGDNAFATAEHAIQVGQGTNSAAYTLQVEGYELLDMNTGKIPADRITGFLPKSGGAMTVDKAIYRNVNTGHLALYGGTGSGNDGAQLDLCGSAHSTMPGWFQLHARNGDADMVLRGRTDGVLFWDSKYVLNNSFTLPSNTGAIILNVGPDYGGAGFRLYGGSHSSGRGTFAITARTNSTDGMTLEGYSRNDTFFPGQLLWDGNQIVPLVASQKPTSSNNYTWYRKYSDGWVEQGGQTDNSKQNSNPTVTLPVPMADANYTASVTGTGAGNGYIFRARNRTTTSFQVASDTFSESANPTAVRLWQVCGYAAE